MQLQWEPGQPKHGFEGLYGVGSGGYRYHIVLNAMDIRVTEISMHDNWEVVTRYARMDRDLDAACRYAQHMEDQEGKPNAAAMAKQHDQEGRMLDLMPRGVDLRTTVLS